MQGDSSTIKQRKDGSYKLVLEGVEKVHWKTKGDDGKEGYRNAASYVKDFEKYYPSDSAVDSYQTFTLADGMKDRCKFTLSSPKYSKRNDTLVYALTPKNAKHADKITGIQGGTVSSFSVQSTEPVRWTPDWMPDGRSMDLRGADLSYADMSGARLDSAMLNNANLSHADLSGARLDRAKIKNANLTHANLSGARLDFTHLHKSNLSNANLRHVVVDVSFLRNANLSHANLSNAYLNYAFMEDANLSHADLSGATITFESLNGANLSYANLSLIYGVHVDLIDADLIGARGLDSFRRQSSFMWFNTRCPDGSMNVVTSPCSGDQLIPLA